MRQKSGGKRGGFLQLQGRTHRKQYRKRLLALILVFSMALSLPGVMPDINVWAEEPNGTTNGEDGYQVVFGDGTEVRMTEEELRAEAESHVDDEDDTVTIEGTPLTWGQFKTMLSLQDLQQLIDDGVIGGYDLTDEAHQPYTASLMRTLQSAGLSSAATVKVYLTKKSDNHYTVDTAKTTNYADYYLNDTIVYYIEDDAVTTDGTDSYVEIEADDFGRYQDYSEATMDIDGDKGSLTVTASRAGSTTLDAKLNYSVYVTTQGDPVKTGTITIPAGKTEATETATYTSTKPEAAYVRFEAAKNCTLKRDDSGNEIKGAACLMGNGYVSSYLVDGQTLQNNFGEEQIKEFISDISDSDLQKVSELTRETANNNNYTASYYFWTKEGSQASANVSTGNRDAWTLSFTVTLKDLVEGLKDKNVLPFTPYTFRTRVRLKNKNSTQFTMYNFTNQATAQTPLQQLTVDPNSGNICDYNSTTAKLTDVYKIKVSEKAKFSATGHTSGYGSGKTKYGDQTVYIYFYPEKYFDLNP